MTDVQDALRERQEQLWAEHGSSMIIPFGFINRNAEYTEKLLRRVYEGALWDADKETEDWPPERVSRAILAAIKDRTMADIRQEIAEWQKQFIRGGTDDVAGDDGQTYYYDYSELPERLEKLLRRVATITGQEVARDGWVNRDAAILAALKEMGQ